MLLFSMFESLCRKVYCGTCFFLSLLHVFVFWAVLGIEFRGMLPLSYIPTPFYFLCRRHSLAKWPHLASNLQILLPQRSQPLKSQAYHPAFWDVSTWKCSALAPSHKCSTAFHHVITPHGPLLLGPFPNYHVTNSTTKNILKHVSMGHVAKVSGVSTFLGGELLAVRCADLHLYYLLSNCSGQHMH